MTKHTLTLIEQLLYEQDLLGLALALHMSATGAGDTLPDKDRVAIRALFEHRLRAWHRSHNHRAELFDGAVRQLIVAAMVEDDLATRDRTSLAEGETLARAKAPKLFFGLTSEPCQNCGGDFSDHEDEPFPCPTVEPRRRATANTSSSPGTATDSLGTYANARLTPHAPRAHSAVSTPSKRPHR